MSTQLNELNEGYNYIQILKIDEDNYDEIEEKRRILSTLLKDKFKKYKSEILNKKYIGGLLKLLKINIDKLKFID